MATAFVLAVVLVDSTEDDSNSSTATPGASAYAPYTDAPYSEDPNAEDPAAVGTEETEAAEETDEPEDPYTEDPYETATEEPDPYESGTCLNGTLPDSTTAQEVSGVDEVSCSASDAHYQVIETIPSTSDMSRCESDSRTQYAFSYRYTLNGATLDEYVYCLVGLGSYAR
ncbi:LppU/SCO3897 family protein [Streptomyces sp. NPDC002911]